MGSSRVAKGRVTPVSNGHRFDVTDPEAPASTPMTRWFLPIGIAWSGVLLSAWVYTKKLDEPARTISPKLLLAFLGVPLFSLLLLTALRLIARKTSEVASRSGDLLIIWVLAFLFCIHASVLAAAINMFPLHRAVPLATALLLLGLGPVLGSLEPNSPMGIRTRRTLSSPEVWTKTHRAAAKMFVLAGVLGLSALLFEGRWVLFAAVVPAILAVVVAVIYAAKVPVKSEQEGPEARPSDDGIR
jgi:uncharacterized membrane protein